MYIICDHGILTTHDSGDSYGFLAITDHSPTGLQNHKHTGQNSQSHTWRGGWQPGAKQYFAPIKSYKSLDYYRAHPVINFDTTYGRGKYKIIGAFMAEVREDLPGYFNYHDYVDMSEDEYNTFITEIDRRSYFNTAVDVRYGDEFITLSTCETLTNEKPTPYRMVVGRLYTKR